jgi:DNA-binding response OmpR family regulator
MEKQDKIILVLEDERPLAEAIRLKLEKNGFEVVTARTVEQGKQYVKDLARVDAIWLDHYLSGKEDGLDFITWCKEATNKQCQNIPVFVISNTASSEKVSAYLEFGAKEFFVKSNHRLDEIVGIISKTIDKNNAV